MRARVLPALVVVTIAQALLVACAIAPTATPVPARPTLGPVQPTQMDGASPSPAATIVPVAPAGLPTRYPRPASDTQVSDTYPPPGPTLATSKATTIPSKSPTAFPQSQDSEVVRRLAHVNEVEINVMESLPVQVSLTLYGYLSDGCTRLTGATQSESVRGLEFHVLSERPRGAVCTKALVPYEEHVSVDLTSLEPGMHNLHINDLITTLEVTQDMLSDQPVSSPRCTPAPEIMVYRVPEHGYCMGYPADMVICRPDRDTVMAIRIVHDGLGSPQCVVIEELCPTEGHSLKELLLTYLPRDVAVDQAQIELGGELAIRVSSPDAADGRQVFWVYKENLYRLRTEGATDNDWDVIVSSLAFD